MNLKISYDDAKYILLFKQKHLAEKYLGNWYVQESENDYSECKVIWRIYLIFFLLVFVPTCVVQFFYIIWNEGLKNYYMPLDRECVYVVYTYSESYKRLQEVYEKYGINTKKGKV